MLTRQIFVRKSGLVLRGEGSGADGTVLYWSKSLQEPTGNIYPWNWGASGLLRFAPSASASTAPVVESPPILKSQKALATTVTAACKRSDTFPQLASTMGIAAGQFIILTLTDPPDLSLNAYLHNNQGWNDYNQGMPLRWVVKVLTVDGNRIRPAQPLRFDIRPEWQPEINFYHPVEESGLEDLRFEFPDIAYAGHQLEPGFNSFCFAGALNCWAKNITIKNCDSGPSLEELTKERTRPGPAAALRLCPIQCHRNRSG